MINSDSLIFTHLPVILKTHPASLLLLVYAFHGVGMYASARSMHAADEISIQIPQTFFSFSMGPFHARRHVDMDRDG